MGDAEELPRHCPTDQGAGDRYHDRPDRPHLGQPLEILALRPAPVQGQATWCIPARWEATSSTGSLPIVTSFRPPSGCRLQRSGDRIPAAHLSMPRHLARDEFGAAGSRRAQAGCQRPRRSCSAASTGTGRSCRRCSTSGAAAEGGARQRAVVVGLHPGPRRRHLRAEAQAHDVAAGRLIFARALPSQKHRARHLPGGPGPGHAAMERAHHRRRRPVGGSAGADVLRAETFVSRAAGSHLRAIGLPELVTHVTCAIRDPWLSGLLAIRRRCRRCGTTWRRCAQPHRCSTSTARDGRSRPPTGSCGSFTSAARRRGR